MTGYVYRGDPWLEHANQAIMDARNQPGYKGTGLPRPGHSEGHKCRNGHRWTPETTQYQRDGTRRCRTCKAAHRKETAA